MSYVLYCQCARRPGRGESQSARRREPEAERAKTACAVHLHEPRRPGACIHYSVLCFHHARIVAGGKPVRRGCLHGANPKSCGRETGVSSVLVIGHA